MNHRRKNIPGLLLFASAMLASVASLAACPGFPTTYLSIKQIVTQATGSSVTSYIEVDASGGLAADPCNCRNAGNSLFLIRAETPVTDGHKMLLALAMEAKALNKKISYLGLSCNGGASGGYVDFPQVIMEQ